MGFHRVIQDTQTPILSISTIAITTAGTSVLIPSVSTTASFSTAYITDILVGNGATQGSVYFGIGTGVVAPTTSAILAQSIYIALNTPFLMALETPIPVNLNANNFLVTAVSCTTLSITALYYLTR